MNPYHRLGLNQNPFTIPSSSGDPEQIWVDRGWSAPPDPGQGLFIQVMGRRGVGKTAHLLHWRRTQPGPYRLIDDDLSRWFPPPLAPITYWDEADRIPRPLLLGVLRRASRRNATVVVATHNDRCRSARGAGLDVQTIRLPGPTPEELQEWAHRRIQRTAGHDEDNSRLHLSRNQARQVVASAGGCWRSAADRLHVWVARLASRNRDPHHEGP